MLRHVRWLIVSFVFVAVPVGTRAEQVRLHFVPVDPCGRTAQSPAGPDGSLGELKRGLGARPLPYPNVVRPTHMVTFRHPYTARNVTVPIRLPEGTPRLEHRSDRIVYNYGEYVVEARFLPDGSVDVVYNSGLLRPLQLN